MTKIAHFSIKVEEGAFKEGISSLSKINYIKIGTLSSTRIAGAGIHLWIWIKVETVLFALKSGLYKARKNSFWNFMRFLKLDPFKYSILGLL